MTALDPNGIKAPGATMSGMGIPALPDPQVFQLLEYELGQPATYRAGYAAHQAPAAKPGDHVIHDGCEWEVQRVTTDFDHGWPTVRVFDLLEVKAGR